MGDEHGQEGALFKRMGIEQAHFPLKPLKLLIGKVSTDIGNEVVHLFSFVYYILELGVVNLQEFF
jgi:hypothetical protein